jgi:hypothetical protein
VPLFNRETTTAKLAAARKRLDETQAKRTRSQTILDHLDADLAEIATREHAGELTAEQAEAALAEIAEKERWHVAEVAHLERIGALLETEIGGIERAGQFAAFDEEAERAKNTRAAAVSASGGFAKTLKALVAQATKLEQLREAANVAAARAEELHPDGASAAGLPFVDEPEWIAKTELKQLVEVLNAGPVRPVASGAATAERVARDRKRQDNELIAQCVAGLGGLLRPDMIPAEIDRLPEHLRERAWERARKLNDDARRASDERRAAEQARRPQRVLR